MALTKRGPRADALVAVQAQAALLAVADEPPAAPSQQRGRGRGRARAALQFPIAATLSFTMASLGCSLVRQVSRGELDALSRGLDTWCEVAVLAGWRLAELALAWFGGLDSLDVAMLDLLSHGPSLYLRTVFYSLSPATALATLAVHVLSAAVPFYLLLPLSDTHRPSARPTGRELVDLPLQLYTTALSTGIYTVVLVLSLRHLLPRMLVVYFNGLRSLEPAYTASYVASLPVTALFGAAASAFIFAPLASTGRSDDDAKVEQFDPVEATLWQTLWWNFWGYTSRTKVAIGRTAATVLATAVNTYLACTMTMHGIESPGAMAYAGVWAFAALCTGLGLGFVGGE